jgi:hypothetical protein
MRKLTMTFVLGLVAVVSVQLRAQATDRKVGERLQL